jgi:hypothetical protein
MIENVRSGAMGTVLGEEKRRVSRFRRLIAVALASGKVARPRRTLRSSGCDNHIDEVNLAGASAAIGHQPTNIVKGVRLRAHRRLLTVNLPAHRHDK